MKILLLVAFMLFSTTQVAFSQSPEEVQIYDMTEQTSQDLGYEDYDEYLQSQDVPFTVDSDYWTGEPIATAGGEEAYVSEEMPEEVLAFMLIFFGVFGVISIIALIFNIVMLVDCLKRDFADKNVWTLILILGLVLGFGFIAAIVYYFMVVKADNTAPPASTPTPPPTVTPPQESDTASQASPIQ